MASIFLVVVFSVSISIPINCVPVSESGRNPTICIADGCMQGKVMLDDSYEAFLGIPFAEPPLFESSTCQTMVRDVKRNNGKIRLHSKKRFAAKSNRNRICLYLNVYRPIVRKNVPENKLLPVMVFIHGGGYFAGSPSPSMVGPQYFMENGEVIFVAMAYRLGVLGFLSTGDEQSPGNFGLKDQALALRWIKSNIGAYGGDENQITIFGVSAGASSVHIHMMSPLSQGLFHKAIVMSGSAIAPYNEHLKNPYSQAKKQARAVGVQASNSKDLVANRTGAFKGYDDATVYSSRWKIE